MRKTKWYIFLSLTILASCAGSKQTVTPLPNQIGKIDSTPKSKPFNDTASLSTKLSAVLSEIKETKNIFIKATDEKSSPYILMDKDQMTSSGDWLAYTLFARDSGESSFVSQSKTFSKQNAISKFRTKLSDEGPAVSWSFTKGANVDASINTPISAKLDYHDSSIYEYSISKVADFELEQSDYDREAFNKYVIKLYLISKSGNFDMKDYKIFAKNYIVLKGGALYDIHVREFEKFNVDGDVNAYGIVKAGGKYYKSSDKIARISLFKMFYDNPAYPDDDAYVEQIKSRFYKRAGLDSVLKPQNASSLSRALRSSDFLINVANKIDTEIDKLPANTKLTQTKTESVIFNAKKNMDNLDR